MADPRHFATRADAFLLREPFSANVISVVLARTLDGSLSPTSDDRWIVTLDGDRVVGASVLNLPYNLFVSRQPRDAGSVIAEVLHDNGLLPPGVTGEIATCEATVRRWCELTGCSAELRIAHRACVLPELTSLAAPTGVAGRARIATHTDLSLLAGWLDAFHAEALPHDPVLDHEAVAAQRTLAAEIWLWERDGEPLAFAGCSQPAACVRAAFERGATAVMLYADQANPTSNGIYQRLGFRLDHEAADYGFRA